MSKWNMIVDVALCENCHNCTLSVKDEHVGNDYPGYAAPQPLHGRNWIEISRKVRGRDHMVDAAYLPTMCNHCDNAPCAKAGEAGGAVRKRPDGIVIIDPVKAKGRRDLVDACPYNAIVWNEEEQLPQIWIFDAHLLDKGWKEPRASQSCPTGALKAIKISDKARDAMVLDEKLEELRPDLGTQPRVFYRNLHRFAAAFLAGTVVADIRGKRELVAGAVVELSKDGAVVAKTESDTFGDFKFDGLETSDALYSVAVSHVDYGTSQVDTAVSDTLYLGELLLT